MARNIDEFRYRNKDSIHEEKSWLSPEDVHFFLDGIGLVRTSPVDPAYYNDRYFSENHVAYVEGYNLEGRLAKYADAIINIANLLEQPVIDLGCGPGYIVEGLRRQGVQVQGVDISEEAITMLSPDTTRHLLTQAPLTAMPFQDGQFVSGYSFHVLEHLTMEELDKALNEITRIVTKNIYLIIPTWDSLKNKDLFNQIISDPTHRVIATRAWWINKFKEFGWIHNDQQAKDLDRINRGWVFFFER